MSEDHIKTVVMDQPPVKLVDDEKSEECRGDHDKAVIEAPCEMPDVPAVSWLS